MNRVNLPGVRFQSRFALPVAVAMAVVAAAAQAQVVQTVNFPASQITGAWAAGGCGTGNERGTSSSGASATMTWTDTTGANNSTVVQIQIEAAWKFWCSGGGYTVAINGTAMGAGQIPSNSNNCVCNASPYETTTQVLGPGTFPWTPNGSNSVDFTCSAGAWIGVMDNASSWSVRLTITLLNQPPALPLNPVQIGPDGKTIPVGGVTGGSTVRLRATIADPDNDDCFLEAEFQPITFFFTQTPNFVGSPAPAGQDAILDVTDVEPGSYHWAVRAVDPFDFRSGWSSFGNNSEITADVVVSEAVTAPDPIDNVNHGGSDCDISVGGTGSVLPPALLGFALLGFGWGRRRR